MSEAERPLAKGRGAQIKPLNRFDNVHCVDDYSDVENDVEFLEEQRSIATEYIPDDSRSVIVENDSPDIPFRYSLNPYRGCSHGCSYCYARPTHEYLGLNAGLDFETKVFVKEQAPELFRDWLARTSWVPQTIVFSGVTDCYQPAEGKLQITRRCLEVALEARQPIALVTKNALVTRDTDILRGMAEFGTVSVALSITTLDDQLARQMEPRTSPPSSRLRAIEQLSAAGIPTCVLVAPVIPGLNDSEIPAILKAAADVGASSAGYILLRLPLNVRPVFLEWLERARPLEKDRVMSRLRACRDGQLNDSNFGSRMRGSGEIANQLRQTFEVFAHKYGLDKKQPPLSTKHFRHPTSSSGQLRLF